MPVMKKTLIPFLTALAVFAMAPTLHAADGTRTLKPVADPLDKLQASIQKAREQAAKDLDEARQALRIAAPGLSEMLENLAEEAKRLEQESKKLGEKVGEQKKPEIEAAKELLLRQE